MLAEARTWPERCSGCGYHKATQGCACDGTLKFSLRAAEADEWTTFVAALNTARRRSNDGLVHQRHARPLLRGRLEPKRIGLAYRRAIREGLIREVSREQSNDEHGRNTNKWEPVYELRSAA